MYHWILGGLLICIPHDILSYVQNTHTHIIISKEPCAAMPDRFSIMQELRRRCTPCILTVGMVALWRSWWSCLTTTSMSSKSRLGSISRWLPSHLGTRKPRRMRSNQPTGKPTGKSMSNWCFCWRLEWFYKCKKNRKTQWLNDKRGNDIELSSSAVGERKSAINLGWSQLAAARGALGVHWDQL